MTRRQIIALFVVVWIIYLTLGVYLATDVRFFMGDSLSRVQSAQSVLFSRDPHVSAIGFIFTPLTAIIQLPLTALSPIFPAMTTSAISAAVMSSAFMAGSVIQLSGIGRDRGIERRILIPVTICYAINPMIVFYAANGMSEAPYLFFLAWGARRGMRWIDTDDVHELVTAGMALGFAYLTRYDGAAASLATGIVVAVVSYRRSPRATRVTRAILDMGLVALPSAVAFLGWALTSWLITGEFFAQVASQYGNASILELSGGSGSANAFQALKFSIVEVLILAPLFPLLLAIVWNVRRRWGRMGPLLAPVPLIGGVLFFQIWSYARGTTFGFLRFYITVVLLATITALIAVPARRSTPFRRKGANARMPDMVVARTKGHFALGVAAVIAMVVAVPVTAWGMTSTKYAPQEFALQQVVFPDPDSTDQKVLDAQRTLRSFSTERSLAQYLDSLDLPQGSVLCDTVYGFAVIAQSRHPKRFVIPSDEDFDETVNNPAAHGVRLMLAVPVTGRGASDALNIRYPTLYENGGGIGVLMLEAPNQGVDLPDWRVYRVTPAAELTESEQLKTDQAEASGDSDDDATG
ncbi:glycosyltransferase family 39 protein [Gordonia hankookensis]|uniref:Glycosyltransferase family 39 protein n=1 Tax=Gordonia hankookensis TaxID=589403 RepID=A0ABR7W8I7_9ACTN|nr:glycosyltransferase family 39 protein [Gordonia hankookensis]MBD1319118.1 glycosyltransferase family 39 protein [Gordonia hankookensis]